MLPAKYPCLWNVRFIIDESIFSSLSSRFVKKHVCWNKDIWSYKQNLSLLVRLDRLLLEFRTPYIQFKVGRDILDPNKNKCITSMRAPQKEKYFKWALVNFFFLPFSFETILTLMATKRILTRLIRRNYSTTERAIILNQEQLQSLNLDSKKYL